MAQSHAPIFQGRQEKGVLADLPSTAKGTRWTIRNKRAVVAVVMGEIVSLEEIRERYAKSVEEFLALKQRLDRFGTPGLRSTRTQQYR